MNKTVTQIWCINCNGVTLNVCANLAHRKSLSSAGNSWLSQSIHEGKTKVQTAFFMQFVYLDSRLSNLAETCDCLPLFLAWTGFKGAVTTKWPWVASWACCCMSYIYMVTFYRCRLVDLFFFSSPVAFSKEKQFQQTCQFVRRRLLFAAYPELSLSVSPGILCFFANH